MTDAFIVDASVVAKWFNKGESNEEEAHALRGAWVDGRIELCCPSLLVYEVCNSIWKNPNINHTQAASLARLVVRLAPTFLEVGEEEASESISLARKSKLTFYDAVYIVVSRFSKYSLITADGDQLKASEDYTKSYHLSKVKNLIGT